MTAYSRDDVALYVAGRMRDPRQRHGLARAYETDDRVRRWFERWGRRPAETDLLAEDESYEPFGDLTPARPRLNAGDGVPVDADRRPTAAVDDQFVFDWAQRYQGYFAKELYPTVLFAAPGSAEATMPRLLGKEDRIVRDDAAGVVRLVYPQFDPDAADPADRDFGDIGVARVTALLSRDGQAPETLGERLIAFRRREMSDGSVTWFGQVRIAELDTAEPPRLFTPVVVPARADTLGQFSLDEAERLLQEANSDDDFRAAAKRLIAALRERKGR